LFFQAGGRGFASDVEYRAEKPSPLRVFFKRSYVQHWVTIELDVERRSARGRYTVNDWLGPRTCLKYLIRLIERLKLLSAMEGVLSEPSHDDGDRRHRQHHPGRKRKQVVGPELPKATTQAGELPSSPPKGSGPCCVIRFN
jgi:hypothetical protein